MKCLEGFIKLMNCHILLGVNSQHRSNLTTSINGVNSSYATETSSWQGVAGKFKFNLFHYSLFGQCLDWACRKWRKNRKTISGNLLYRAIEAEMTYNMLMSKFVNLSIKCRTIFFPLRRKIERCQLVCYKKSHVRCKVDILYWQLRWKLWQFWKRKIYVSQNLID